MRGVTKFYDQTAGILALERPCGVIVNMVEMFMCESPTQVYLFLIITHFAHDEKIHENTRTHGTWKCRDWVDGPISPRGDQEGANCLSFPGL